MDHDRRFVLRGLAAAAMLAPLSAVAAAPAVRPPTVRPPGGGEDQTMRATEVQHRNGPPGVRRGPPPARRERMGRRPPGPRDRYVWRKGYWVHQGNDYVWRPGSYMERPRPRATWVPDRWVQRGGRWVFIEGRWR